MKVIDETKSKKTENVETPKVAKAPKVEKVEVADTPAPQTDRQDTQTKSQKQKVREYRERNTNRRLRQVIDYLRLSKDSTDYSVRNAFQKTLSLYEYILSNKNDLYSLRIVKTMGESQKQVIATIEKYNSATSSLQSEFVLANIDDVERINNSIKELKKVDGVLEECSRQIDKIIADSVKGK